MGDGERSVERNIAIQKKGSTHKEEERDGGLLARAHALVHSDPGSDREVLGTSVGTLQQV